MLMALLYGLAASSALVIGGVAGALWKPPEGLVATGLAFASGALVSALAFDLFAKAFRQGGSLYAAGGFLAGGAVFILTNALLERLVGRLGGSATGFALVAAVTLDGVPENLALGVSLLESSGTTGIALLAAIFASNLPEALGGAAHMREKGQSKRLVIGIWMVTAALLAASVVLGRTVLGDLEGETLSVILAFAGGAVLASLADTLMPDAYSKGGPFVAFATVGGFLASFLLSEL
jgi:ZIP family zinc transporter